ncbi:uncharacterized protein M421DRAFT_427046 [Didymella exigua CBS 183.55]|uniref:F-box domain-containing protein n=1 Tax=Didymella exigua CBS 183.55 TaxID=1150837 RepID=A0A6A5R2P0_9PLEO|nr:uncharacterized protein M421DRAFT_427046 [Didymella exigua CBS 183.55]KAF1922325.1 hypothetical protein M421DRAFT_427046 [Didymella exigua CBS 183.55]
MTADTERDAFGRLPEELRVKIIKLSPDPLSLRCLAHASPAMGRVLDRYPLEIVEVILEVTVPVEIRRLIHAVLKLQFSRFPASLSEAQRVAKIDSTAATSEMRSSRLDRAASAVQSLLTTAANVHNWSHACLEHLIRKSMQLRPSTLIKNGAGSTRWEEFENAESRKDYLPQDTGPPSWVEEQRMIKSFWQLQFFLELQGAGHKGHLGTNWPRQEVDVLSQSSADGFYDVLNYQQEQILTACDFLGAVTSGTINLVEAVHDNASNLPTIRWVEGAVLRCSCAEPLSFERNKDTFNQGPENLDRTPWAYHFHHAMSSSDRWLDGSPLTLVYPFQTWRKYGFAIWDDKRMVDLGMRHPRKASVISNSIPYSFRWWSILTEEDMR